MKRNKMSEFTITGLLTALAIVIPMIMPVKVLMPPFTATLASHLPLIVSMFISPFSAIITALGSAIGFYVTMSPIVAARAATHVIFTLAGAYMIRKHANAYLTILVTMILHSASDMLIVYIIAGAAGMSGLLNNQAMGYVMWVIAIGTSIHHLVDYAIAIPIINILNKAKFIDYKFKFGR